MEFTRRKLLATGVLTLSGCLGTSSGGKSVNNDNPVASASIPEVSSKYTYATMGDGTRPTVTYYGNWKCPYCAEFSTGFLKDIVTDYVKPGKINLRYRALAYINGQPFLGPDAPRAARAGLAVWNVDPDTYWKYHEYVMANQPPEQKQWATVKKLVSFAKQAGVSQTETIRKKLATNAYESAIRATSEAATEVGVSGTPMLVIGGKTVNPLANKKKTRSLIEQFSDKS